MTARRWRPGSHSLLWDVVGVLAILALIFGGGALLTSLHRKIPSWYLGADETSVSACGWDTNNPYQGLVATVVFDNPSDRTANLGVTVEWDDPKRYPVTIGTGFEVVQKVAGFASRTVRVQGYLNSDSGIDPMALPTADALTCKVTGPSTIPPPHAK